jgi:hypothetical protein
MKNGGIFALFVLALMVWLIVLGPDKVTAFFKRLFGNKEFSLPAYVAAARGGINLSTGETTSEVVDRLDLQTEAQLDPDMPLQPLELFDATPQPVGD